MSTRIHYDVHNNKENAVVQINDKRKAVAQNCLAATRSPFTFKVFLLASLFVFLGASECMAEAQTQGGIQPSEVSVAQSMPFSVAPDGAGAPLGDAECQKYDKYNTRMMTTAYLPSVCDSFAPGLFGLRESLGNSGWGLRGTIMPTTDYDIKNRYSSSTTQKYAGQVWSAAALTTVYFSYDLSRIGFPLGSQFGGAVTQIFSTGGQGEPPAMDPTLVSAGITVPLFDNTLELKAGTLLTTQDFVGMSLTGNAGSTTQGLQSSIPALVGMSVYTPTPTAEITVRDPWTKRFYNRFGVSRSTSPDGALEEMNENPTGLKLHTKNTGPMVINEFGYKTEPGPGRLPLWARTGVIYNTTDYSKYDGTMSDNNYAAYAGVTMQLTKNAGNPGGLSLDMKFDIAPSDRNIFYKDYAINLFYVGPFESRPFDMVSVGYSKVWESPELQDAVALGGARDTSTTSIEKSIAYSFRVSPGIYWISSASLVSNPGTVAENELPTALILTQKVIFTF